MSYIAPVLAAPIVIPFSGIMIRGAVLLLVRMPLPIGAAARARRDADEKRYGSLRAAHRDKIGKALYCRYQLRSARRALPHLVAYLLLGASFALANEHAVTSIIFAVCSVGLCGTAMTSFLASQVTRLSNHRQKLTGDGRDG